MLIPNPRDFVAVLKTFVLSGNHVSCDLDRLRSGIGIWYTVGESDTIYNNFNTNNRPWRILLVILLDWQSFKLGNLSFEQSKFHEKCKSLFLYNRVFMEALWIMIRLNPLYSEKEI